MSNIDTYLHAATRANTRQSYQAAVRHFEVEWGGFLPATADAIARYLADHAESLAVNTLKQRLAALAQWHLDQGFPDPTKAPVVKKVLRGIRALHPAQEKQAKPLQLDDLERIATWLDEAICTAQQAGTRGTELRHRRDKAIVLLGFWRGFRGDELARLQVEHVKAIPGEGMSCYFPHTKADRQYAGTTFKAPALARLCPVEAVVDWMQAAQLTRGPLFRAIDRWEHLGNTALHPDSLVALLRTILVNAGVNSSELYSVHSLRRGFANWATSNGWDIKTLMQYVGWKNVQTALRYVDSADPFAKHRIAQTMPTSLPRPRD
ncbi:TPA: tyrosine-type recombinase/integrase [Legionella pneumophila subsp. pneumophila]|nr:tyrosine-type recombinase/integrase [Legionella pneumophila subsp. pneumophila]